MPKGREAKWESTVKEHKNNNIFLNKKISKNDFVKMRNERDASLPSPKLMLPSIQVNIRAGYMPPKENNGDVYKIPLKVNVFSNKLDKTINRPNY